MYSRAPQINQNTEFWYFTLTTRSYMKDGPQEQASANTQIPYLGVFGLFEHVFQRAKYFFYFFNLFIFIFYIHIFKYG